MRVGLWPGCGCGWGGRGVERRWLGWALLRCGWGGRAEVGAPGVWGCRVEVGAPGVRVGVWGCRAEEGKVSLSEGRHREEKRWTGREGGRREVERWTETLSREEESRMWGQRREDWMRGRCGREERSTGVRPTAVLLHQGRGSDNPPQETLVAVPPWAGRGQSAGLCKIGESCSEESGGGMT